MYTTMAGTRSGRAIRVAACMVRLSMQRRVRDMRIALLGEGAC